MAASAPHAVSNWNETRQYGTSDDTKTIEIGMSGLSFVSNVPGSVSRPPALSGSSISSAPEDHQHHRQHSFGSFSFPNSDSQNIHNSSTPPSPSSHIANGTLSQQFLSKPPGLSEPTYGAFGHQGFDQNWGSTDADSFDRSEDPDDGLLGLGAMRERAHSSPGPMYTSSSSPPGRIDVNPYQNADLSPLYTEGDRVRGLLQDPRRHRSYATKSNSGSARPPLSGQSSQQAFLDNSFGSAGNYGGRGSPGSHEYSYDYSPLAGGRSDLAERLQGRVRSLTAGSEPHLHDLNRSTPSDQFRPQHIDHSQKFGSLPSLNNIQRLPPSRHIRSYSHSGTLQVHNSHEAAEDRRIAEQHQRILGEFGDFFSGGGDNVQQVRGIPGTRNIPRSVSSSDHHSSRSAPNSGLMQRSVSMTKAMDHQDFESQLFQRRSPEYHGDSHFTSVQSARQQMFPSLLRRDEFVGSDGGGGAGLPRPTYDDMRSFGNQGFDERGRNHPHGYQVPLQMPVRRHSDYVNMPSGSMSGTVRNDSHPDLRSMMHSGFDDDLTHPLAGEDIDDPGDDLGFGSQPTMQSSMHHAPHVTYYRNDVKVSGRSPTGMVPHYLSVDASHLPTGPNLSGPRLVYTIKFKRTQRNFIPGPRVVGDLKIGCYVKVEADRGEDLGIVVNKIPAEKFNTSGRTAFRGSPGGVSDMGILLAPSMTNLADLKRVVRLATHDEVALLAAKREEEEELLKVCREKVQQRSLPMHVVDAEYQFDRHKLTFFFEAECRIDFRELVRDLFSMYKTRIWMQQLDKNISGTASPSMTVSPLVDYGNVNQVPVMADNINELYGIPQSDMGGAGGR